MDVPPPATDASVAQTDAAAMPRRSRIPSVGASAAALCFICVGSKGCLLPFPGRFTDAPGWLVRLALVSATDAMFCAALAAALIVVRLVLMRMLPQLPRLGDFATAVVFTAAGFLAVASVPIFLTMNLQITYPLLTFAGNWRTFGQSVRSALTPEVIGAVLMLPFTLWFAARGIQLAAARTVERIAPSRRLLASCALAAAMAIYIGASLHWIDGHWTERSLWQHRVARSPHWSFLESLWFTAPAAQPLSNWHEENYDELLPQPLAMTPMTAIGRKPNIVLLVLESVGAEAMQVFGSEHPTTPELAKLADRTWCFDAAYAQCPSSSKSLVSLLSGTYPRPDLVEQTRRPTTALPGLAAAVRTQDYRTAFIHSGDWSWRGGEDFIRAAGFEHFQDARNLPVDAGSWGTSDDWLFTEGLRWIDAAGEQPFLLMLWTVQTHHPYRCDEPTRDFGVADPERHRYLNAVADVDRRVGQLWRELERRGLAESTVVVITGDHGEAFGTHGQRLHIFGIYEENVRVPLIFLHDGRRLPVGRTARIAEHIDIAPTIAELCGATGNEAWQGRSLLSGDGDNRAYFYTVWDPILFGLRDGDDKFIAELGREEALYHLSTDANELRNLAAEQPARVAELRRRVELLRSYQYDYLADIERPRSPRRARE